MTALQLPQAPVVRQKVFTIEELGLLNATDQGSLKYITRVARRILSSPMALIGVFVEGEERQFLLSALGLPDHWEKAGWVPLSQSFSQFVRNMARPLAVEDKDTHPLGDQLVDRDSLPYRSYLGAPIFAPSGEALGALCVLDTRPRQWREEDVAVLEDLAHCVTDAVLLRAALLTSQSLQSDLERALARSRMHAALRDRIVAAFTEPDKPAEERLAAMLAAGCRALGMSGAVVTRVDGPRRRIIAQFSRTPEAEPARERDIAGTMTEKLMSGQEIVCHGMDRPCEAASRRAFDDSLPKRFIGAPLLLDGIVYGTLEFHSNEPYCSEDIESDASVVSVIAMFTITQLEVFSQIDKLRRSESALLQYILDLRAAQ